MLINLGEAMNQQACVDGFGRTGFALSVGVYPETRVAIKLDGIAPRPTYVYRSQTGPGGCLEDRGGDVGGGGEEGSGSGSGGPLLPGEIQAKSGDVNTAVCFVSGEKNP